MLRMMTRVACSVVLLACVLATPSAAQPMDKRTLFTFSGPVAMPGVTLPAGQYLFRLANPDSGKSVVQVLSPDGRTPYGMFFTMAAERFEAPSTPEVRFMETAAGMPAAIRTWWYPGDRRGYEFVYPKDQARRLAEGSGEPVLTTQSQSNTTEQTNTSDLTRMSAGGQETNVRADATPSALTPTGASQQGVIAPSTTLIANATLPAPIDPQPITGRERPTQMARAALPQTASTTPLVALLGSLALITGIVLAVWPLPVCHD